MPTAARIVAAICIAFVAWIVSGLVKRAMPAGTDFGYFVVICVVIGLACGWTILGSRADRGRLGFGNAFIAYRRVAKMMSQGSFHFIWCPGRFSENFWFPCPTSTPAVFGLGFTTMLSHWLVGLAT